MKCKKSGDRCKHLDGFNNCKINKKFCPKTSENFCSEYEEEDNNRLTLPNPQAEKEARMPEKRVYKVECPICNRNGEIFRISGDNTKPFYCPDCRKMRKPKEKV